ncbi:Upstream-binding factor 1-like protein [Trichinella pseudospiralis]
MNKWHLKISKHVSVPGTVGNYRRFKFENVVFKDYSAKDLRKAWRTLRYRAYGERNLVQDVQAIEEYIAKLQLQSTDRPKKPLSAYMYFITKRYAKLRSKHPSIAHVNILKTLAEEWRNMDAEKKKKYQRHYESEKEDYNRQMEEFYEKHPEEKRSRKLKKKFLESRSKKYSEKYGLKGKDLREKLRHKFENLSEEKRRKWIMRAENTQPVMNPKQGLSLVDYENSSPSSSDEDDSPVHANDAEPGSCDYFGFFHQSSDVTEITEDESVKNLEDEHSDEAASNIYV